MATTKINTPELFELESSTSGVRLPSGTTAQRPSTNLNAGDFRYNTDDNKVEYYDGSDWFQIDDEALPAIPSENFNTILYVGNGSSQSITGVGFAPDLVVIKNRVTAGKWWTVNDTVRGTGKRIFFNNTNIELSDGYDISSFNSDGFTTAGGDFTDRNGEGQIAFCWKAGGPAVLNENGNIDSNVSVNTNAGFSIVSWQGAGTGGNNIGHGLGVAPKLITIKNLSNARNWRTYTQPLGATKFMNLDTTEAAATYGSFGDTPPTTDVFYTSTVSAADRATNYPGEDYIAYCFADVAGYQKIGSYPGDGNASGPIVNTGFEPAFVMIKNADGGDSWDDWYMSTNKTLTSGYMFANDTVAEQPYQAIRLLTNGFQVITTDTGVNQIGNTYIYLAIASDPTSTTPSLTESFKTNLYTGNGAAQTIGGHLNGAAVMAGNGSITLPSSTSFDGTSNLSFSLWVFRQNTNRTFIMDKGQGGSGSYGWQFEWHNASSGFVFQMNNTSNTVVDVRTGAIANNEQTWEHVVVTFNPSTFEAKIYYNGILCDLATHSGTPSSNTGDVTIGTYSLATGFELTGSIDQFRFFNTVLTASQVSELYNETSSTANTLNFPTGAGCFAAYPFDSNANDLSGNYNASSETNVTYSEGTSKNPSLVWIKLRDTLSNHDLIDSVRGATNVIESDDASAEFTEAENLKSFNSNGFTVGTVARVNKLNEPIVAWNWGASTLPTANSEGTVPSVVCINDAAGFSIVKYTGTGANATVGHGLEVKPNLVLYKDLDAANNWTVYSSDLTASHYLKLNTTNEKTADAYNIFNGEPDTSVLKIGSGTSINTNGNNIIAYCFANIDSYQKIGAYNGSSSTVLVTTEFEPAFVIIKRTDSPGYDWIMYDQKRSGGADMDDYLAPNTSTVEVTGSAIDITATSNGFTVESGNWDGVNTSGGTYIYIAIAADPDTTTPTVADSFDVVTYSGSSSSQNIDVDFKADLVFTKSRNASYNWGVFDSVRGAGNWLQTNTTDQSFSGSYGVEEFNTNSIKLYGNFTPSNYASTNYVAYLWKAGDHDDNLPQINTEGTIDSIVSVNDAAGFSIVKYIGNGTDNATVGTGLSSAAELVIVKDLNNTNYWVVGGSVVGNGKTLYLNDTSASLTRDRVKSVQSNTFTLGSHFESNGNGANFITYCWYSVTGHSKIGSYTGTGAAGNAQTLGFKPRFIMIKSTSNAEPWFILDSKRSPTNPVNNRLMADSSAAEDGGGVHTVDFTNTGFTANGTVGNGTNGNGVSYIYMAFK